MGSSRTHSPGCTVQRSTWDRDPFISAIATLALNSNDWRFPISMPTFATCQSPVLGVRSAIDAITGGSGVHGDQFAERFSWYAVGSVAHRDVSVGRRRVANFLCSQADGECNTSHLQILSRRTYGTSPRAALPLTRLTPSDLSFPLTEID